MVKGNKRESKECCDCNDVASATPKKIWNWTWLLFKLGLLTIVIVFLVNIFVDRTYSFKDWWNGLWN